LISFDRGRWETWYRSIRGRTPSEIGQRYETVCRSKVDSKGKGQTTVAGSEGGPYPAMESSTLLTKGFLEIGRLLTWKLHTGTVFLRTGVL